MLENNEENKPKRGRPRKYNITSATGDYFREFEDSIVLYNSMEDRNKRDKLFREKMYLPLRVMTQTILRKYFRSRGFPIDMSDEELIVDTMSFIVGIIDRFDNNRGTKCYSYIQTVIKHYLESVFRGYFKNRFKQENNGDTLQRSYYLDEIPSLSDSTYNTDESEHNDLINAIIKETVMDIDKSIENRIEYDLNDDDCLVGDAIINILSNYEELFNTNESATNKFNKSVILYKISEMTLLNQKIVKMSLKKFKEIYKTSKQNLLARY